MGMIEGSNLVQVEVMIEADMGDGSRPVTHRLPAEIDESVAAGLNETGYCQSSIERKRTQKIRFLAPHRKCPDPNGLSGRFVSRNLSGVVPVSNQRK